MTLHVHDLTGCSPTPLAHYLKAIGILRLISEQGDPNVRGYWNDDRFCLLASRDRDQLVDFFLTRYQPTPLLAPWNGGSGFFPKDKKDGIDALANSVASRFEPYRQAITDGRQVTRGLSKSPKESEKSALLADCRRR